MKPLLGIMQGRLLPQYKNKYQAHPVGSWESEFPLAAALGLNLIEWILDYDGFEKNPIMCSAGIECIRKAERESGIAVQSVCADLFMEYPFHGVSESSSHYSLEILRQLIGHCRDLGVKTIVIPCVDCSSVAGEKGRRMELVEGLRRVLPYAEQADVNLALETDLDPIEFRALLEQLPSPKIAVNYDVGNSASLGYNVAEEWAAYGDRVVDIHLKDRVRGSSSTILGTGDADFDGFFAAIDSKKYSGIFIMQAFRDSEGIAVFRQQMDWILPKLEEWWRR